MKNSFKYIKNIFKVLIWPILFMIGQFFINYIFVAIYNSKEKGSMSNLEFLEHIKSLEYQEKLNNYDNIIVIIFLVLIFCYKLFN